MNWRKYATTNDSQDFILIREAYVNGGVLSLTQATSADVLIQKGWIDDDIIYRKPIQASQYYNIYIMAGQSNMVGYDTNITYLTGSDVALSGANTSVDFYYEVSRGNNSEFETTSVFTDLKPRTTENPNEFGPELSFGRELVSTYGVINPVIVKVAAGASGLYEHATDRDWNVNTVGSDSIYARLKAKINEAIALVPSGYIPRIRAFIWNQGERESNASSTPDIANVNAYKANLQALISDLKATYASYITSMKVVITTSLLQDTIATTGDNLNRSNIVRLAQIQVADEEGVNGAWVSTDGFRMSGRYDGDAWNAAIVGNGNAHYLTPEYVKLGVRYAEAVAATPPKQIYRYQFINNGTTVDIAPSAMVGVRAGTWSCRANDGSLVTNTTNATPGFLTVSRELDVRELYDSPKSIGTCNFGWASNDIVRRAYIYRDVISTLNKNNANKPILAKNITTVSCVVGCANTNTGLRLLLKIGGQWVLQNTPWTIITAAGATTSGYANAALTTPGADFDFESERFSLTFSRTASNWLAFTDASDGTYSDGDAFKEIPTNYSVLGADIGENDAIEEIGFYGYSVVAPTIPDNTQQVFVRMNNIRIDVLK
jgi:hypothetical protein